MHEQNVIILLIGCCCCFVGVTNAIDMDYYFSYLRNKDCYSRQGLQNCKKVCQEVPVLCHDGQCYCHQSVVNAKQTQYKVESLDLKQEVQISLTPQIAAKKNAEDIPGIMLTEEALRPTRKHHIAHFCPSLDVARKCIRKCMETGKPAFCGKDHTCYCGHKYGYHDSKDENNAVDTYKEFADMYAKYFGNTASDIEHSDESGVDDDDEKSSTQSI